MSEGSLKKSRAMVSLAITGNTTPYKDSLNCTGVAHISVSLRTNKGIKTNVKKN